MDEVIVYQITYLNSIIVDEDLNNIIGFLRNDIEEFDLDDEVNINIKKLKISKKEYQNLPEFEGF